ncbi:MAG: 4-demethylwyosine synthase TYW1 [Thermoplasmata archaeon HGW-Thermoplasmata-1]|nr:MAG: 4-demethylwyosine synthase TYW1 [Thermoplasmata archaeon HGW-Thermoplasmata-1]
MPLNPDLVKILQKQHYALVGEHTGVKLCHWMRQSLLHGRQCYKADFYGITTHRCLQMTPTINHCNHKCLYCWRYQGFNQMGFGEGDAVDDPAFILDESIKAQFKLLTGFKGDPRCEEAKWNEAIAPRHVACSLSGEPTLYPRLSEFFEECHKRGMTTFLVTNGTTPEALAKMDTLPRQLYVSVDAPSEEIYKNLCAPLISKGWEKLNETLELLPSLGTRTVLRHTLVDLWNIDGHVREYARLDRIADPLIVEPKGYVFVGYSRQRMTIQNMPSHEKIKSFSEQLAQELGYEFAAERSDSRVTALAKDKGKMRIPGL